MNAFKYPVLSPAQPAAIRPIALAPFIKPMEREEREEGMPMDAAYVDIMRKGTKYYASEASERATIRAIRAKCVHATGQNQNVR